MWYSIQILHQLNFKAVHLLYKRKRHPTQCYPKWYSYCITIIQEHAFYFNKHSCNPSHPFSLSFICTLCSPDRAPDLKKGKQNNTLEYSFGLTLLWAEAHSLIHRSCKTATNTSRYYSSVVLSSTTSLRAEVPPTCLKNSEANGTISFKWLLYHSYPSTFRKLKIKHNK